MASYSSDRRSVLKIIGAIGATCAYPYAGDELFGQAPPEHHHTAAPHDAARFFNEADFRVVSRMADLIIPETNTPSASGAGVPAYIDMVIGRGDAGQQQLVADGLRWLDAEAARGAAGKRFIELPEDAQYKILEPLCEAADSGPSLARNVQFFVLIKKLTADGYYTSKIGLIDELGYTGNKVLSSFEGCVHEH